MTDKLLQLVHDHFNALLISAGVLLAVVLALGAVLWHDLMTHYEATVKAARRFIQILTGLRKAAKGDATADDDLAQTISQPQKPVPDPREQP